MDKEVFNRALDIVLISEGGYSDHSADRGGKTMWGITQGTFEMWLAKHGKPKRPVKSLIKMEMQQIYYEDYWLKSSCQHLGEKLAICHFDAAVNHGIGRANKFLQKAVGVTADGDIGQNTLDAVQTTPEHIAIRNYLDVRDEFYHKIVERDPSQAVFMRGWMARIEHLEKYVVA